MSQLSQFRSDGEAKKSLSGAARAAVARGGSAPTAATGSFFWGADAWTVVADWAPPEASTAPARGISKGGAGGGAGLAGADKTGAAPTVAAGRSRPKKRRTGGIITRAMKPGGAGGVAGGDSAGRAPGAPSAPSGRGAAAVAAGADARTELASGAPRAASTSPARGSSAADIRVAGPAESRAVARSGTRR